MLLLNNRSINIEILLTLFVISLHSVILCLLRVVSSRVQRSSLDIRLQAEITAASLPPQQLCSRHHSFSSSRRLCSASTSSQRAYTGERHVKEGLSPLLARNYMRKLLILL